MLKSEPIRVAVTGATGRMGQEIIRCIIKKNFYNNKIKLAAAIVRENSSYCGVDIGKIIKTNTLSINTTDDLNSVSQDFDVLIDFTSSDISLEYFKFCLCNDKNIVIGTTGFNKRDQQFIKDKSENIGVVYDSNFSVGITLIIKLLQKVTQIIGPIADISILETHHNKKKDSPSGTALILKDVIMRTLSSMYYNQSKKDVMNYFTDKSFPIFSSINQSVPIHSIRLGNIIGEHTILFVNEYGESLEIKHTVLDRSIFAIGAINAAIWLNMSNKTGIFNMSHVLNIF